jgi:pilus assembly protein CpaE
MRVVIASEKAGQREAIRPVVLGAGLECSSSDCVAFADLAVRLAKAATDLVLIGIGGEPAPALAAIRYAVGHTSAPVLAVGPSSNPTPILQAIRAGAREYLDESKLRDELRAALEKLVQVGAANYRRGKAYAITAAAPGTGVTTIATSLAFALAQHHPKQVVLAELGAEIPELALDLDLEPRHSLAELAGDWQRLDPTMMKQALVEHSAGVSVLAYHPDALVPTRLDIPAIRHTLVLLRSMFEYSVVDLGHVADAVNIEAMHLCDPVVVVVRLDVPSLRLSRQFIRRLGEHGVSGDKLCIVANRYGQRRQLHWKRAQEALGLPIQDWIPDAPAVVNQAINQGLPLVTSARRAKITRVIGKLAQRLNGRAA